MHRGPYLQRCFDVTAESGNNSANVSHKYNEKGEGIYKINVGMSDLIQSSEDTFFRMFYDLEILVRMDTLKSAFLFLTIFNAFPIYYEMVRAIICFEENDRESCLNHLENITFDFTIFCGFFTITSTSLVYRTRCGWAPSRASKIGVLEEWLASSSSMTDFLVITFCSSKRLTLSWVWTTTLPTHVLVGKVKTMPCS